MKSPKEYWEESTQISSNKNQIWIRKRTDPMIYIILFFIGLATLFFGNYLLTILVALGLVLFYVIKFDILFNFNQNKLSNSLLIGPMRFETKSIFLTNISRLVFQVELLSEDESNIYKPLRFQLYVYTSNAREKLSCYFEEVSTVYHLRQLVSTFSTELKIEIDMNGLEKHYNYWYGRK